MTITQVVNVIGNKTKQKVKAVVDTDYSATTINRELAEKLGIEIVRKRVHDSEDVIDTKDFSNYSAKIWIQLFHKLRPWNVMVVEDSKRPMILGMDFLNSTGFVIDSKRGKVISH